MTRAVFSLMFVGGVASTVAPGWAASVPRLAINIESDGTVSGDSIRRMETALAGKLLKSGRFQVVDRNRLDAVIREQGFSNSSYADPKTAAALGKLAGASRILTVSLTIEADTNSGAFLATQQVQASASYSLVGVDSGQILSAGSAQGVGERQGPTGSSSSVSEAQLEREAVDQCADDLASQLGS